MINYKGLGVRVNARPALGKDGRPALRVAASGYGLRVATELNQAQLAQVAEMVRRLPRGGA